jgi:hypothetical protein
VVLTHGAGVLHRPIRIALMAPPRRRKAIATTAAMIGALILARTVDDPALSDEILAATSLDLSEASDSRANQIRTP